MEKREDHDEKGPRLKPGLYTEDGEIETEDRDQRAEVQEKIPRSV